MQEAVPDGVGAMAAVLGLDRAEIRRLCRTANGVVGSPATTPRGTRSSPARRARSPRLPRRAARRAPRSSSCPFPLRSTPRFSSPWCPPFHGSGEKASFHDPRVPVIDNVGARALTDAASVRRSLVLQVSAAPSCSRRACASWSSAAWTSSCNAARPQRAGLREAQSTPAPGSCRSKRPPRGRPGRISPQVGLYGSIFHEPLPGLLRHRHEGDRYRACLPISDEQALVALELPKPVPGPVTCSSPCRPYRSIRWM